MKASVVSPAGIFNELDGRIRIRSCNDRRPDRKIIRGSTTEQIVDQ